MKENQKGEEKLHYSETKFQSNGRAAGPQPRVSALNTTASKNKKVVVIEFGAIPTELKRLDQWMLWKYEVRDGKRTKPPYSAKTGGYGSSTNPAKWSSFARVCEQYRDPANGYSGIGFVVNAADPYCGVDLDDCLDGDGEPKHWVTSILAKFASTYSEVTPSGKGIRIWVKAKLREAAAKKFGYHDGAVEVYDRDRFFAVTGKAYAGSQPVIRKAQQEIDWLLALKPKPNGHTNFHGLNRDASTVAPGDAAPKGKRHEALVQYGLSLRNLGLDRQQILPHLTKFGKERCDPPKIDEKEIRSIAEWAGKATPNFLCSEGGNADRLVAQYGQDIRYVQEWKRWAVWDGTRWNDQGGNALVRDRARAVVRDMKHIAALLQEKDLAAKLFKFALASDNRRALDNMVNLAQDRCGCDVTHFDRNPRLLNVKNGTIDLVTGMLRRHRREDYITKLVPYDYHPDAQCPKFLDFLKRITKSHAELIPYLQRALGYSVTGSVKERAIFVLHGRTNTGKTTLLNVFRHLMSEYSTQVMIDSLMRSFRGGESTGAKADLSDLRGARFAQSSETEEGQRFSEGRLKRLTQGTGSVIKSCRKYENPIEFPETHKLWIDANHLPELSSTDDATWERLHAIPFDDSIPEREQVKNLAQQLVDQEAEGILAWLVSGSREWFRKRLQAPTCVRVKKEEWRAESDPIASFIKERCVKGKNNTVKVSKLYSDYCFWCEDSNIKFPLSKKAFGQRLRDDKRFTVKPVGANIATWFGLGLRNDSDETEE